VGKRTPEPEAQARLKEVHNGTIVMSNYVSMGKLASFDCLVCGYDWETAASSVITARTGCKKCYRKSQSIEEDEAQAKLKKTHNETIVMSNFTIMREEADFDCLVCGHDWRAKASSVINSKHGCKLCGLVSMGRSQHIPEKTVQNKVSKASNGKIIMTRFKIMREDAEFKCLICKEKWETKPSSLIYSESGCPYCCEKGFDNSKSGFLYIYRRPDGYLKVGKSNDPHRRMRDSLNGSSGEMLYTWEYEKGKVISEIETAVLKSDKLIIGQAKLDGKSFDGATETTKDTLKNEKIMVKIIDSEFKKRGIGLAEASPV